MKQRNKCGPVDIPVRMGADVLVPCGSHLSATLVIVEQAEHGVGRSGGVVEGNDHSASSLFDERAGSR